MNTGLIDKNGMPIRIGDKTKLVLDDGEERVFDVCFKTVQRTFQNGDDPIDVSITGIVFCWKGYDLFPCVDKQGISEVSKMEVIHS